MTKVIINFTKYPDGSTTLKIGDRGNRISRNFRTDKTFFNPTEKQIARLFKVPHITISSSRGEIGWWQLWQLNNKEI